MARQWSFYLDSSSSLTGYLRDWSLVSLTPRMSDLSLDEEGQ